MNAHVTRIGHAQCIPEWQSLWGEALCYEGVCKDVCGGGAEGGVRVEQLGNQGLGRWAYVVWDVVLVVLDPVIGLLQTLCLKRRLANEQGIAEEQKWCNHSLGLLRPASQTYRTQY